uniref:BPTI/Kunitz inhibitor domain-containing protein n=1 Tax=Parascaris univalens TaxID=6257 RepID=A0A914ZUJ0_PARUN
MIDITGGLRHEIFFYEGRKYHSFEGGSTIASLAGNLFLLILELPQVICPTGNTARNAVDVFNCPGCHDIRKFLEKNVTDRRHILWAMKGYCYSNVLHKILL